MVVVGCDGFEGLSLDDGCVLAQSVGPPLHRARQGCHLCSICPCVPHFPVLSTGVACRAPLPCAIHPILIWPGVRPIH
jgi:hypothetical protein